eukprot:TRINITY_DN20922_c0_g1_i1.p1 TRINITY_DN20922_c0_g1~~TRINITY_DN20922_c0_g1_i1.p1  ORF type:complete len:186 (-),score=21.63 TRINITY_DN20922_c0_g1_i1:163-669(-)
MRGIFGLVFLLPVLAVRREFYQKLYGDYQDFSRPSIFGSLFSSPFQNSHGLSKVQNDRRTGYNSISISPIKKKKLGELVALKPEMHPMRGTIYYNKDDESMIIVSGFYYPSPGPDAFFWAGSDSAGCDEHSIDHNSYPDRLRVKLEVRTTTVRASQSCPLMTVSRVIL